LLSFFFFLASLPPSAPPSPRTSLFFPFLGQAHIGCLFMVAYMIIFSAITSLELFIQVKREEARK